RRELGRALSVNDALLPGAFASVWHPWLFFQHNLVAFEIYIAPGDAPPLADAFLHDVALNRTHPSVAARTVRTYAPIKDAAVAIMLRLGARRPFFLSPLVF